MKYSPKNHVWAVIQSGQCVFGTGRTREAAIYDAETWMSEPIFDGDGMCIGEHTQGSTHGWLKAALDFDKHVDGDVYITNDAEDIRSYVENQ